MNRAAWQSARHPSAPEWQMLRALARDALANALLHGAAQFTFHCYRVKARRLTAAGADTTFVELTLVGCGAELLDRVRIAVAFRSEPGSACRSDSLQAAATAARPAEFLAGCVSPVDARYASPETGQIS